MIGLPENDGGDDERYPEERRLASAIRAMMSVAGVDPLPGWVGFEVEPGDRPRWAAMLEQQGQGSLPAWALAGKADPDDEDIATGEEVTPAASALARPPVSDLARACIDQVERMAQWRRDKSEPRTDEQLDADLDAWGAALRRAIAEPSANLADLAAKARLMLADMEHSKPEEERTQDDERLMLAILREVAALASA
ncbi:hypothetical protein DA075_35490 (plasmid) [Methylobacterium currus]|uniref:Uncharacterized protein n=1 Tax=Methylobacterium currus TaxID=2051553 RepID=A0A2R4WX99_9HYPH|nr:hypothetical protein [Methylobacterium currus]AWB26177.1 hypothetical protein DA075_35490 [Methylobacterium currus]